MPTIEISVKTQEFKGQQKKNYGVQVHLHTCKCVFDISQMKKITKERVKDNDALQEMSS